MVLLPILPVPFIASGGVVHLERFPLPSPSPPWPYGLGPPFDGAERWLKIDLSTQTLTAYQGSTAVREMPISSGVRPEWTTPNGTFWIYRKIVEDRMRGHDQHSGERWDVAHVPWAQYFKDGIAIHGAWWNHHFGIPNSHGCIQVPTRTFNPHPGNTPDDAAWLYRFTTVGTMVRIVGTTPERRSSQPLPYPTVSAVVRIDARFGASSNP